MRLMGIDYGRKRVGLALSDGGGRFAFPYQVLVNTGHEKLARTIASICEKEKVELIVLGESKDFQGRPNPVMTQIAAFKEQLAAASGLPIAYQPEFLTSAEAERLQGKTAEHDASAAALILKSYLDQPAK